MGGHLSALMSKPHTSFKTFHELSALTIDKQPLDFAAFKGKVVLAVNVASKWGLTNLNYKEMAELKTKYEGKPFEIVAFPCNQFAMQEPGTNAQIKEFAAAKGFTGVLMDKVTVNGRGASPVYDFLKVASGSAGPIGWNFAKFLVRPDGSVAGRYSPQTAPSALVAEINALLAGGAQ